MTIIITGGTGLLGKRLSKDLLAMGEKVVVLSRSREQAAPIAGVEVFHWDGKTPEGWIDSVEGASVIINLAGDNIGSGLWTQQKKNRIITSRVQAGNAVVEAVKAARNRPRLVIQASGIGYYGTDLEAEFDETSPKGSDWLADICVLWEESTRPVENLGVRRVVIRTAPVLDATGGILPRIMLPFQWFVGGQVGSGKQWISWIHPCDYSRTVRQLIQTPQAQGVFNLSAPAPERYAVFAKTLAKVMGRPYWAPVPGFALKLALGEMSTLVLDGQRVVPRRLLEMGFQFQFPDLQSTLTDLLRKG